LKEKNMRESREIKRFTAKRRAELAMDIFQGKITVTEVSGNYDLAQATIEESML
jgi:transposase-like protein